MSFPNDDKEVYHSGLELATSPVHSPSNRNQNPLPPPPPPPDMADPQYQNQHAYPAAPPPMSAHPYDCPPRSTYSTYSPIMDNRTLAQSNTFGPDGSYEKRDGPRILGMRPASFFLMLALFVVIIIGAVGGGVGGSVAADNARKDGYAQGLRAGAAAGTVSGASPSTVTVTTTASAAESTGSSSSSSTDEIRAPTQGRLALDCPNIDGSTYEVKLKNRSWTFQLTCGIDYNGKDIDIAAIVAYSAHDCMMACASYNNNWGSASPCVAAEFSAELTERVKDNFGTCFIKNGTGTLVKKDKTKTLGARLVSNN